MYYRLTSEITVPAHSVTALVDIRCSPEKKHVSIGKLGLLRGTVFGSVLGLFLIYCKLLPVCDTKTKLRHGFESWKIILSALVVYDDMPKFWADFFFSRVS